MKFRLTPDKIKLSENDVELACSQLLMHHYWPVRQHVGKFLHPDRAVLEACKKAGVTPRWATMGEPGDPDWIALHHERPAFFLETKRPGEKLNPDQEKRIETLAFYGFETAVVDRVEALIEFLDQYEKKFPLK